MVFTCSLFSFAITRPQFVGKRFFAFFAIFTMLFGGGTIPYYLVVTGLKLDDTLWSIILPGAVSAWNIILMKNFIHTIPHSLCEAAEMDGANNVKVLVMVVMPLSFPVIASVILFTAVGFWNNWFGPLLFIKKETLQPAQAILRMLQDQSRQINDPSGTLPTEAIKNAAIVVTTLPIILVYPFLQRYFINGVIVGAVKG
jgi:putative aldouronate transport system permease protein